MYDNTRKTNDCFNFDEVSVFEIKCSELIYLKRIKFCVESESETKSV